MTREQLIAQEAQRMIEQHEASKPPKRPSHVNQIYTPGQGNDGRTREQVQADAARDDFTRQLIGRLADRDERHG